MASNIGQSSRTAAETVDDGSREVNPGNGSETTDDEAGQASTSSADQSFDEILRPRSKSLPVCPANDSIPDDGGALSAKQDLPMRSSIQLPAPPSAALMDVAGASTSTAGGSKPSPELSSKKRSQGNSAGAQAGPALSPVPKPVHIRGRDPLSIRQQYMAQLGIDESRRAMQRLSMRRQAAMEGIRVKIKDAAEPHPNALYGRRSIFQALTNWYSSSPPVEESAAGSAEDGKDQEGSVDETRDQTRKRVNFDTEAKVHLIPIHSEYSELQRGRLWHTRAEFIEMVERNMGEVYDEMEKEYEEQQRQLQIQEEAEARKVQEDELKDTEGIEQDSLPAQMLKDREDAVLDENVNRLASTNSYDNADQKQQFVRSQEQIRQEYLKNLGIE